MIGKTIAHYTITGKIGEGGMGEVYLATDLDLDRRVALKFLPSRLALDGDARQRLLREARAASRLNHPNLVTIYGIEHYDDTDFIAMEYVQGQTLREFLDKREPEESVIADIAGQMCAGLSAAHSAGVVHRDIKPENIILTKEGRAKIMDFGLATWKGASQLTKDGSTLGTIAYMSPEQVQHRDTDHRSDLWSLGVVLYEMLTRRKPFGGDHEAAIIYSVVNEAPEPLARYTSDTAEGFQPIVAKLLEKDPGLRYQSATDVSTDLRRLGRAAAPKRRRPQLTRHIGFVSAAVLVGVLIMWSLSMFIGGGDESTDPETSTGPLRLAVLPLENLGDASQDYFADGLTDEISLKLGRIPNLAVISRTSASQYRNGPRSASEIGADLGVTYLLEGSVRWQQSDSSSRVRVIPRLVNTADNTEVWSQSYEEDIRDVFAIQAAIAEKVADALNVTLVGHDPLQLADKGTQNIEAYDYFLRANEYFNRGNVRDDLLHAAELYERAVGVDPNFAEAYARLGMTHVKIHWWASVPSPEHLEMARTAIDKALTLQPNLAEARLAMGYYHYWGSLDYGRALLEFTAALEQDPNNSLLLEAIGYVQRRLGDFEHSLSNLKKSLALDPRSNEKALEIGNTYYRTRQWEDAEHYIQRALALAPDYERAHKLLVRLFVYKSGDLTRSREILQEGEDHLGPGHLSEERAWLEFLSGNYQEALANTHILFGDTTFYYLNAAQIHAALNKPSRAVAFYDSARVKLEAFARNEPEESYYHRYLALAYAGVGRDHEAIQEIEEALRLAPLSKDAFFNGPIGVEASAQVHTMIGDVAAAIDDLERVLELPAGLLSIPYLRIAPEYHRLKSDPRFQRLLDSLPPL